MTARISERAGSAPYTHSISGCLDGTIGAHGLGDAALAPWIERLVPALDALKVAGCRRVYIDGSFVTLTIGREPGDFDGCWEIAGVNLQQLDPVLMDFTHPRAAQKAKYGGEMFPAEFPADGIRTFLEFFQRDKHTGAPKGIVALDLGALP